MFRRTRLTRKDDTAVSAHAQAAQAYNYDPIDYPGADSTAGFTISPSGEIGGLACAGPSCQGFLFRPGQARSLVTPPGASSSYVTGVQRGGFLLSGQYNDATGNAHGYVWDLLHPGNFAPIDPDSTGVLFTEVADMSPAGNLSGWYLDPSDMATCGSMTS